MAQNTAFTLKKQNTFLSNFPGTVKLNEVRVSCGLCNIDWPLPPLYNAFGIQGPSAITQGISTIYQRIRGMYQRMRTMYQRIRIVYQPIRTRSINCALLSTLRLSVCLSVWPRDSRNLTRCLEMWSGWASNTNAGWLHLLDLPYGDASGVPD